MKKHSISTRGEDGSAEYSFDSDGDHTVVLSTTLRECSFLCDESDTSTSQPNSSPFGYLIISKLILTPSPVLSRLFHIHHLLSPESLARICGPLMRYNVRPNQVSRLMPQPVAKTFRYRGRTNNFFVLRSKNGINTHQPWFCLNQ